MADQNAGSEEEMNFFEASTEKLSSIVSDLESNELALEPSLKAFEEGIALVRKLQTTLQQAEQEVFTLLDDTGELQQVSEDADRSDK